MFQRGQKHSLPRRLFRWCRISVLLVVLIFVSFLLWSNYVSVPEFIAAPIRTELRRNNVALQFDRLRLSGFRRLVAEDLRAAPASAAEQFRVRIAEAQLLLSFTGDFYHPLTISGLRIERGEASVAVNDPGAPPRYLSATNLHAVIAFLPQDTLRITSLGGEALGAKAHLSGLLRNFSQFRFGTAGQIGGEKAWHKQLAEVETIARQLTFSAPPEVTVSFAADAADLANSRASLTLRADQGASRWGSFQRLRVSSTVYPLTNQPAVKAAFTFNLQDLRSDSGKVAALNLAAETEWSADMQRLLTNHVGLSLSDFSTRWVSTPGVTMTLSSSGQKDRILSEITAESPGLHVPKAEFGGSSFRAELEHALPFPTPAELLGTVLASKRSTRTNRQSQTVTGQWRIQSSQIKFPRSEAESIVLSGDISSKETEIPVEPELSFWEFLRPLNLPWQLQLSNLAAGQVKLGNVSARGDWSFPELSVLDFDAVLYNGRLNAYGGLNVVTRRLSAYADALFDYHEAAVLLDPPVQRWLEQFAWEHPPLIQTEVGMRLPPWTNSWARFAQEVVPTLALAGNFVGRGSFRGVPLGLAESSFTFSNYVWSLPDLRVTRPEGKAAISYSGNVTNQEVFATITSQIDPSILASAFDPALQPAFQFARFPTPPLIQAEIRGDLDDFKTLSARGNLSATNFFLKEQAFSGLRLDFAYTNQLVYLSNLFANRGKEKVTAPRATVDIPNEVMFVTNAVSTMDPYIAMSIVGDEVYDAISPYRFANTPTVLINGFVPLRSPSKADIHFHVSGTEFSYWRFHLPGLSGDVYWKGDQLSFSNIHALFYNGRADWSAHFDIDNKTDTAQFSFRGVATDASLHPLVRDLFDVTNRLDGTFNGELTITSANTASIRSWNGFGKATLRDGYLWSIPIFGMFSKALDSVVPGLGSTPVSSGAGNFQITNSVIHTTDLQVRAPAFRLNYKGNVDLDGNLNAIVEAELLRDAWLVGKLFSTALWPVSKVFEARVTGVLNNPKTSFRYVPKFLLAPFKILSDAAKNKERKADSPAPGKAVPAQQDQSP